MGCCQVSPPHKTPANQILSSTNPSEWTEAQISTWLKVAANGHLASLRKPFKKHKISGLAFANLTKEELQQHLHVTEYGLVKEFILQRDKLIAEYQRNHIDTVSTTHSNSNHSKLRPHTPSSSGPTKHSSETAQKQHSHHKANINTTPQLTNIDDERETSPLLEDDTVNQQLVFKRVSAKHSTTNSNHKTSSNEIIAREGTQIYDDYHIQDEYKANAQDPDATDPDDISYDDDERVADNEENVDPNVQDQNEDEMDDEQLPRDAAEDECFMAPLHESRVSQFSQCSNYTTRHKLWAADAHGWKNVSTAYDDKFITVHDLKWKRVHLHKHTDDSLDVLGINQSASTRDDEIQVYDFDYLEQYQTVSYIGGCKLAICGFIRSLHFSATNGGKFEHVQQKIYSLCLSYFYEAEKHIFQIGYDIWKLLPFVQKTECVENDNIKSFDGQHLLMKAQLTYYNKYRLNNTIDHINDLIQHGYIELIAKREGAPRVFENTFIDDNKYLYAFQKQKKRQFKKYHCFQRNMLDREAWCRGTEVEIFSHSMNAWMPAEILQILPKSNEVTVSYRGGVLGTKYMYKKIARNDPYLIRSTWDFKSSRVRWSVGSEIEVYSNSDGVWYAGVIEEITPRDMYSGRIVMESLRVKFQKKSDGNFYMKQIDQWSAECRDVQRIANSKLSKYKNATQCQVYDKREKVWITYNIKDIIPKHEYVVVSRDNEPEKMIDFSLGGIRLLKNAKN
eukprot:CAMPEP_0197031100 /NCGR_PEP_ID=MMETSP1384-20130603/10195_1 /TAXON_ID=29189 /ORGANISM="Ammonia sp." /LENGTH=731 /DNA_ID=CAMNT_0042460581 /DNA_START=11 /DNA_END=2206 /DNA_ORIENTATION=+